MFLSISEFIGALKSRSSYEEKFYNINNQIEELANARINALENINSEQYYHIKTSLSYEVSINEKGEKVEVLKPRTSSKKSATEIIAEYDKRRECTNRYYDDKIANLKDIQGSYKNKICEIDKVLNAMPSEIRNASIRIFVDGLSYKEVADTMFVSSSTLYRSIQKEIENAIARK